MADYPDYDASIEQRGERKARRAILIDLGEHGSL
jgi:hypothetical protein